jgi:membrane protease YdiL (CAAX protease family)
MDELSDHEYPSDEFLTKRKRLYAILKFLLFAAAMSVFLIGLKVLLSKIPATASLLRQAEAGTITPSVTLIVDGVGFVAVVCWCVLAAKIERRAFGTFGLPLRGAFRRRFVQGVVWGLILAFLDIGCTYLLGGFSFGALAIAPGRIVGYGIVWALVFTTVGLFEEFLYRGYALYNLTAGIGFWPAAILLSALFGSLHLMNAGEGIVGALDVMLYGLFACFTLKRTGNLWFAVGLHAAWDFSLTFVYSVPGSGMQAKGQLLHAVLHGATWLSGGSAGPEGSAIGLAVLILSFPLFSKLFPVELRRGYEN